MQRAWANSTVSSTAAGKEKTTTSQGPTFPGLSLHLSKVHNYSENKIFWIHTIVFLFFLVHPLTDYFPITALEAFLTTYFYSQWKTRQKTHLLVLLHCVYLMM